MFTTENPVEKTEAEIEGDRIDNELAALERELEGYTRYGRDDRAGQVEDAIAAAKKRKKAALKDAPTADTPVETGTPTEPGQQTATPPAPAETGTGTNPVQETARVRPPAANPPAPEAKPVDLSKLNLAALKDYATENGVDIGDATTKATIRAAIEKAAASK